MTSTNEAVTKASETNELSDVTPTGEGVYHVNDRKGRVNARGEDLIGREILLRVELSAEKYELWTVAHGKAHTQIQPDEHHRVKPGDHFRATIRGSDYSVADLTQLTAWT